MGVINITPNSFSDGQKFFHTPELVQTLKLGIPKKDLLFDFGFESTAPMNGSITESEERRRFDVFFEQVKSLDLNHRWISFDTYRPESFAYFESRFKQHFKGQGFVFNDVSGVIDDELIALLKDKKRDPLFKAVFSFTHIPSRAETGKHEQFLREDDICQGARARFLEAHNRFLELQVSEQVIFDPGFGFSKSFEQNWQLLKGFSELKKCFLPTQSWLVGLSKKSFLRKALPEGTADVFSAAEVLHESLLRSEFADSYGHVFFRVHDFDIVSRAFDLA